LFKQELGISPWDYLNRYRVFQAKELLRQTNDSIGHVGQRVGFSDASYFSRVFRRLVGISPGAYREQNAH
jgi:AraC-like DNA-binding protein